MFKPRKTVAGVMAAFTRTIDDLNTVAAQNEAAAEDLTIRKDEINREITSATNEADSARSIAAKLSAIVDA